jgi:Fe-S cluster biogenesis protein NfuA
MALDDRDVRERVARLDEVLERLEQTPGATAEAGMRAIELLTGIYGEALTRVVERVSAIPELASALADDELLGHLFMLHEIHPAPLARRVELALDDVRPYVHSHRGEVELVGVEGSIVRIRLSGTCGSCSSSSTTLDVAVRDAVLAAAAELTDVVAEAAPPDGARPLIPLETLRRPARDSARGAPTGDGHAGP